LSSSERPTGPAFDLESHRRFAVGEYQRVQGLYEAFGMVLHDLLSLLVREVPGPRRAVFGRTKSLESFGRKAALRKRNDATLPRYPNPVEDIDDLAALRIATAYTSGVDAFDRVIRREFRVLGKPTDKGRRLVDKGKFGYRSVHYLICLKPSRVRLPEYETFEGLRAKLQVRTMAAHAWAEIEHGLRYRATVTLPSKVQRRLDGISAALELFDYDFEEMRVTADKRRADLLDELASERFDAMPVSAEALQLYLDIQMGVDPMMSPEEYEYLAGILKSLDLRTMAMLHDRMRNIDYPMVSRAIWGCSRPQLGGFEDALLVAFGEKFIRAHPFHARYGADFDDLAHERLRLVALAGTDGVS
jgi:ppGpp synthetase/RelA/SpoT-type nucleotidyltranferase